jgi:hypothetical protein
VAGGTTAAVAYVDHRETKEIVSKIGLIIKEFEDSTRALDDMLRDFQSTVIEMIKLGYTEQDAVTRTFIGCSKELLTLGELDKMLEMSH